VKELKNTSESVSVGNNFLAENKRLNQLYDNVKAKDYWSRLGITVDATETEIKEAYRRKFLVFDPDKHPEGLKDINRKILALYWEAEAVLISKVKIKNRMMHHDRSKASPRSVEISQESAAEQKKRKAIKDIERAAATGVFTFQARRDIWVNERVITLREANSLPGVKSSAIQDLEFAAVASWDVFKTQRNRWMEAGVITKKEAKEIWRNKNK
jgi:curved DNA-binding protein CbpA